MTVSRDLRHGLTGYHVVSQLLDAPVFETE
jgi:hypothetical protein